MADLHPIYANTAREIAYVAKIASEHTEQALVELVYIQTSNNLIGSAMANLDEALSTTQSVLNILQAIQNLHNQITVTSKSAFPFLFSTAGATIVSGGLRLTMGTQGTSGSESADASNYQSVYNQAASAYFGQAISPTFVFSSMHASGYASFQRTLELLTAKLRKELILLSASFGAAGASAINDPTTLLGAVNKVYDDLPKNFRFSTVEAWALDNYNANASANAAQAGALQNDLTDAITAAENLNDTQKEQVRRFLFIFQEYYQSAASVLSSMTQIIEQIAQKISQ